MIPIKTTLILTVIFSSQLIFAQAKKSPEEILKEVSEKTKSYSTIKVAFTYNMDNPSAKVHESESGTLLVKGDKYRLDIAGQVVMCDAVNSWTYLPESNEVQINSVEEDEDVITPTKLLTSYSEDYKSKLAGEATRNGKTHYVIELKPNTVKSITGVELQIDKELMRIMRIALQDKSGNTFTYIVDKFETNVPAKDSDFTFNPGVYPGVEVIDMR
jgi:outer membrane lipoprotein-sorting protein